jgi:hypothetical protein
MKGTDNLSTLYWQRRLPRRHFYDNKLSINDTTATLPSVITSRFFHLDDEASLTLFNSHYPQSQPWRLYPLHQRTVSSTISALQIKTSPMALFLHAPKKPSHIGTNGRPSATNSTWILPFKTLKTPSLSSKSLPGDFELARSTPRDGVFVAEQWRVPYGALARRSREWGPRTHATLSKAN